MDPQTILNRLESGESIKRLLPPTTKVTGLGEIFFQKLVGYYGVDALRLANLGRHWQGLVGKTNDPAWVYRSGGVYERSLGRWQASAEAFLAAGDHAPDSLSQKSFKVGAIDSLARAGKLEEAHSLAKGLSSSLKKQGEPGLAARALLNLGNALVYQDRMIEARRVLLKALPDLISSNLPLEAASAKMALSSTYLFGGNPRLAERYAQEVIADAESLEAEYLANLARLNLALSLVITGRPEEAHQLLIHLRPELQDSPVDDARVGEYLGDALLRLNLWVEAEESYRQVLDSTAPIIPLHRANLSLGMGQALHLQHRWKEAKPFLRRAAKSYAHLNNQPWQAHCLYLLSLGDIQTGRLKPALSKLREAEKLASESPFHLAQIFLAQSSLGVDRLQEAKRIIRKNGYLDLDWQIHFLKAKDSSSPGMHYRRMFSAILAGRMATRSVAARMGFLKDKAEALKSYLGWLLEKPTPSRIGEAIQVIEQVRSATLLDEILQSGTAPPQVVEMLERARAEFETSLDESPTGQARYVSSRSLSIARAQKIATEGLLALDFANNPSRHRSTSGIVLAETDRGIRILQRGKATLPNLSNEKISEVLRWLPFELMAPMADPSADPLNANKLLHDLATGFKELWESDTDLICPDGDTWKIPWTACAHLAGFDKEWSVSIHPHMNAHFNDGLTQKSKAVVWLGQAEDLPFSGREAESIRSLFDSCLVVTDSKEARQSLLGAYDVIHVVSHAVHRAANPMLSSIEFPDGPLFAYEIARSPLKVRLATLSACETGSLSLATRSEPDGLARAFLARGAQSVIASQWPLDDEAAFRQFDAFYRAIFAGSNVRDAIFQARCICREWREHPYYWGALALYSGYKR